MEGNSLQCVKIQLYLLYCFRKKRCVGKDPLYAVGLHQGNAFCLAGKACNLGKLCKPSSAKERNMCFETGILEDYMIRLQEGNKCFL